MMNVPLNQLLSIFDTAGLETALRQMQVNDCLLLGYCLRTRATLGRQTRLTTWLVKDCAIGEMEWWLR
jgi:hypothetical protein